MRVVRLQPEDCCRLDRMTLMLPPKGQSISPNTSAQIRFSPGRGLFTWGGSRSLRWGLLMENIMDRRPASAPYRLQHSLPAEDVKLQPWQSDQLWSLCGGVWINGLSSEGGKKKCLLFSYILFTYRDGSCWTWILILIYFGQFGSHNHLRPYFCMRTILSKEH